MFVLHKIGIINKCPVTTSTIQTTVAGLSYINKMMGFKNLTDHFVIKKLLLSDTKTNFSQDKRVPITIPILRQLLDILKVTVSQSFSQTLYKAMFTTAFFALLRVREMTFTLSGSINMLQLKDITYSRSNKGVSHIFINIKHHKHSKGMPLPITLQRSTYLQLCPVRALCSYIQLRGPCPGPLFLSEEGCPLTSAQFAKTLETCVLAIGLNPANYTSHSFELEVPPGPTTTM